MNSARFIQTRKDAWLRLDALISKAGRAGASALTDAELHELVRLYPAVAVDVARARMHNVDKQTQERINRLAVAAHGMLYRRPSPRPGAAVRRFFAADYPRLFRKLWLYVLLSAALFSVMLLASYVTVRLKPSLACRFVPGEVDAVDRKDGLSAEDMSERFRQMPNAPIAAGVMTNNIRVAFLAFAFGVSAGIGTCYLLFINAMMLGGFAAHFANNGLGFAFLSFITAHGVLEIAAILIAAAAGLRLGLALAVPGQLTRKASLREGARESVLLVLGTIPMFVLAGIAEGFITPSYLPGEVKIVFGIALGGTVFAYLLLAGRKPQAAIPER